MGPVRQCAVSDCTKPTRGRMYCSMHSTRLSRYGSLELPQRPEPSRLNANGYRVIQATGHPVAHRSGTAFEHRVVLYDAIGPGSHPCNWCGKQVSWGSDLQTDHVDHDPQNNAPDNLVPSCGPCNVRRNSRWANKPTRCSYGHEFTVENTYIIPTTGARQCRTCSRGRKAAYKKRNVGACHGCGRRYAMRGPSNSYCVDCADDPMRAASNVPETCSKGHRLTADNLTFVRASSKYNRMRWRCQQCTREKSYAAYLKRRALQRVGTS